MGYRKRDRLKHQLMAECVYAATYAMRSPEGKTVADMFPQIFEDDDGEDQESPMTDEEASELQAEIDAFNAMQQLHQSETQP